MSSETVVLRALGLGDLLTVVPALRGLRRRYPAHRQFVTCAPWLTSLARYLGLGDEWITEAVDYRSNGQGLPGRKALETAQLDRLLGPGPRPALGLNLRGTRTPLHTAVLALRPRRYIAFHDPEVPQTTGYPVWDPAEHEVLSWCRLLREFDVPCDPADLFFTAPRFATGPRSAGRRPSPDDRPADRPSGRSARLPAVVHPGAGRPARHWPADRWADVVHGLAARGYDVLVSCAWHEADRARLVVESADGGTVLRFQDDDILSLVDTIAGAALLISVDTGVPHLANALRVPSVVLFGPSSPARWGPPPAEAATHACLWAGRTGDPDGEDLDPGLAEITAEQVLGEVDRFRREGIA
ncbi:MAG: glycosyltransferase family 9 protein [Egibacteraceae bacterium]